MTLYEKQTWLNCIGQTLGGIYMVLPGSGIEGWLSRWDRVWAWASRRQCRVRPCFPGGLAARTRSTEPCPRSPGSGFASCPWWAAAAKKNHTVEHRSFHPGQSWRWRARFCCHYYCLPCCHHCQLDDVLAVSTDVGLERRTFWKRDRRNPCVIRL